MKRHHLITGKLTALTIARVRERGTYGDGHGLYLQVARGGSKSWVLRYKVNGRTRILGLGPTHTIGLAVARERAAEARRQLIDGTDPIEAKRARRDAARLDAAKAMSFDQCAAAYIAAHRAGWRNARHAEQWQKTLATPDGRCGRYLGWRLSTVLPLLEGRNRAAPPDLQKLGAALERATDDLQAGLERLKREPSISVRRNT
jgi:hypothetical protein